MEGVTYNNAVIRGVTCNKVVMGESLRFTF
jgi:hypothetical protein